jgi:hypothetical protein
MAMGGHSDNAVDSGFQAAPRFRVSPYDSSTAGPNSGV